MGRQNKEHYLEKWNCNTDMTETCLAETCKQLHKDILLRTIISVEKLL